MKSFDCDADIDAHGRAFLARTLPKSEWTHAGHFAAAFWILRHPDLDALRDMPDLIRRYNESTGVANTDTTGYHETITLASLRAARAWLTARPTKPLHESLSEMLLAEYGRSDWLLTYWSRPLLFSAPARRSWVEPDLMRLPF